jgi:hypothetical protein
MTARVLIVDDLIPNLKLIEARLSAEYFEVLTATNGADALALCASGIKGNKAAAHIPVVMVTALDQPSSLPTDSKPVPMISSQSRSTSSRSSRGLIHTRDCGLLLTNCGATPFVQKSRDWRSAQPRDGTGGRILVAEEARPRPTFSRQLRSRFHWACPAFRTD